MKVLRGVGIEDINCKQILAALPSDFPLLKGADFIVVESAKSLGLPICVKPFLHSWMEDKYALKDFSQPFVQEEYLNYEGDGIYDPNVLMFGDATCRYKPGDITWCQELSYHQPAGAALVYGNEESLGVWYKSAAILIRIPKWSNYRQKLIAISMGKHHVETEASHTEDGVVKDFKDIIQDYDDIKGISTVNEDTVRGYKRRCYLM